jgi:uncharacterized membrane protein HdeD (DUF308 family)
MAVAVGSGSSAAVAELRRNWWQLLLWGIAAVLLGIFLLAQPQMTAVFLIQVMAWFWLFGGLVDVIGSLMRREPGWGWRLALGALSVVAALLILASPFMGALIVVGFQYYILAFTALVIGLATMFGAFSRGFSWGHFLLGLLQVGLAIYLVLNPTSGVLALLWVVGILAIAGGVASIIAAFQARSL